MKHKSQKAHHVNTVEAKNNLNALISKTRDTKQPIIVEKRGEPVAVVLDFESYQQKISEQKKEPSNLSSQLQSFHRVLRKKYPQGTGDSVEILRQIREERTKE